MNPRDNKETLIVELRNWFSKICNNYLTTFIMLLKMKQNFTCNARKSQHVTGDNW